MPASFGVPDSEAWCDCDAGERGKVAPVEVMRQTYRRIHLVNPGVNAFVVLCEERALAEVQSIPHPVLSFASVLAVGQPGERPLRVTFSRDLGYVDNVWPEVEEAVRTGVDVLQGRSPRPPTSAWPG